MQQRSCSLVDMSIYLCVIFIYFLHLTQHCDAVRTRDVQTADVPSEMFKTVEAATEQPLVFNTVPPTNNSLPQDGPILSESTKTSVTSNSQSQYPTQTFGPQSNFIQQPSQRGIYRPIPRLMQGTYASDPFPYPVGPRSSSPIQRFPSNNFPFNGDINGMGVGGPINSGGLINSGGPLDGGNSRSFYYSSSSSSSDGPVFQSGFGGNPFPSRPSSRFQSGPGFVGDSFGGGSDGFYQISSSQTSYDSNMGVPITKHFEYDSRDGGGLFRKK